MFFIKGFLSKIEIIEFFSFVGIGYKWKILKIFLDNSSLDGSLFHEKVFLFFLIEDFFDIIGRFLLIESFGDFFKKHYIINKVHYFPFFP